MDLQSPLPVTNVRRNPPRKAKQTSSTHGLSSSKPSNAVTGITPFPLDDIHEPEPLQTHSLSNQKPEKPNAEVSKNLKVFLRIRPLESRASQCGQARALGRGRVAKEGERKNMSCLFVNSSSSVTLNAPPSALESKRAKNEFYDGFSHVFAPESVQEDIYDKVMQPLVMDFMEGHSSLLVAMGPTGSGKTYTMFGSPQQLGIVPLALRKIFSQTTNNENIQGSSRTYYLSMFEILSERGKGEKIFDLFPESMPHQQASISSLKEVKISSVVDAEKIVAHGIFKRSTAPTNANNQSSRSQCIINVRCVLKSDTNDHSVTNAVLTIADLAGAERERKTGNQGTRLMESSFINNTSMVFGQCLRSLLEHQKNPKKPIEKHFKNSLLTRYLQDYMEGKKQMTLILTVKAAQEDYVDTSFILRQASPYMKIKFYLQENNNAPCQKRKPALVITERSKKRKVNISEVPLIDGDHVVMDAAVTSKISEKDYAREEIDKQVNVELQKIKRSGEVMKNFAKALLSTVKQYKYKLKESENEVRYLKESLIKQSAQAKEMEKELNKIRNQSPCQSNLPDEKCAKTNHGISVPLIPSDQDNVEGTDALPDENNILLESKNEVGYLKESLRKQSAQAKEMEEELNQIRNPSPCQCNLPVEESVRTLSFNHGISMPLIPSDPDNVEDTDALPNENNIPLSPENSAKSKMDQDAKTLDQSFSDPKATGVGVELSLSLHQRKLQQVDMSAEAYSSLPLEENAKELSYQYLDANPESFQKLTQSYVQVGEMDHLVMNLSDVASLTGIVPREGEGCFSNLCGHEEISILQAEKEQSEVKAALAEAVQQSSTSYSTEAVKSEEDDPSLRPLNSERPKRKLLPASAIYLKDFNGLFMDENAMEVKRKKTANVKARSDGSISLIRLLKSNLPR